MADPENRIHLTAIECVNACGDTLPPMLVLQGVTILQSYIQPTIPAGWQLAQSDSGYANDRIMLQWFEFFEAQTRNRRVDFYRLLIFIGIESHTDDKFIR